ncbi:putative ATPase [Herbihabitans rhizosphaerae]|uniref:Putative ATPase n=1 Tax=Herbihabitans rhizosphaerae TaxID=1872711 RepID=A0A4Q7L812_9PSEU|nr:LuxR C-terminal-related transcriptional regulator [Herbihabitans rhizosphaerae]RZS45050.1 putative ATPase [Herbihabitans rhizosphaerae]
MGVVRGGVVATSSVDATSYVGRRTEAAEVRALLRTERLVTLTGTGGVGKTRLAVRVARDARRGFPDGVTFVDLASLRDGGLLPNAVAEALGLSDRSSGSTAERVLEYLRTRQVLLVLDNCEHLLAAAAEFARSVMIDCPRTVLLATSRQSLGVQGEQIVAVPPLPVPPDDDVRATELTRYAGVRLFLDRVAASCLSFRLTDDNAADVAQLCRRLDGVPLAVELAAARVRLLSPRQINERLAGGLGLLTTGRRTASPRQQTLRATVEWSHELCSPAERAMWARVSVFAGSFDLEAAEDVCGEPVLDLLEGLLDKSVLVREDTDGFVRYRMLETLRAFGQERLDESGDADRVRQRHLDWVDRLTATADQRWVSAEQQVWARRLRQEHANLRAALDWSLREPARAGTALRIATRLDEYWRVRGSNTEALMWLTRALDATPADHPGRAKALAVAALRAAWLTDLERADTLVDQADAANRGDRWTAAFVTYVRAFLNMIRIKPGSRDLAASAAAEFRALGDVRRELHPLFIQGVATAFLGELETGRSLLARMIDLSTAHGDAYYRGIAKFGVAAIEVAFGDVDRAEIAALEALAIDVEIGNQFGAAYHIDALAWVAARCGRHQRAATLFGAADPVWEQAGADAGVATSIGHREFVKASRAALGAAAFDTAFQAGRAMSIAAAYRYALGEDGPADTARDGGEPDPLTAREREVAELVAKGMTNSEIAEQLVISVRTAGTHVRNILVKLDFANRAQIAAWIAGTHTR